MKKLDPCPFCGSDDINLNSIGKNVFVQCECCKARGPVIRNKNFLAICDSVIKSWNKRKEEKDLRCLVMRLIEKG